LKLSVSAFFRNGLAKNSARQEKAIKLFPDSEPLYGVARPHPQTGSKSELSDGSILFV